MNQLDSRKITVEITSFSYKLKLPSLLFSFEGGRRGGGFIFDCRCLPNPGRLSEFKEQTGLDDGVIKYLLDLPETEDFKKRAFELIHSAVNTHLERGFDYLSVGFGCTGGQHRSVFMSEQLSQYLKQHFSSEVLTVSILHSNLNAEMKPIPLTGRTIC